jgi:hypothetical protein
LWLRAIEGFLGWWHSCNQPADNINQAIDWRAMTRVLDLRNVFQLVNDAFDDGTLSQQQAIC